jgi:hypothetical protein
MNSSILLLQSSLCNITIVLPLSTLVTIKWFWFIFFFILSVRCRSCDSDFDWVVCHLSFSVICLFIRFWMLFATICLIYAYI